jgi:hypothetical protein
LCCRRNIRGDGLKDKLCCRRRNLRGGVGLKAQLSFRRNIKGLGLKDRLSRAKEIPILYIRGVGRKFDCAAGGETYL